MSTGSAIRVDGLCIDDKVELICDGVSVLVKVIKIGGDIVFDSVFSFEDYDPGSLNGVERGDILKFPYNKIHGWSR